LPDPVASGGRNFRFNSSEPKSAIGAQPSPLCAATASPVEPQPRPISSMAIAALIASTPAPPNSSGTLRPSSPIGPIFFTAGQLNSAASSV
jgi:hypothetical protein